MTSKSGYPTLSAKNAKELGEAYRAELGDLPPRSLSERPGAEEEYVVRKKGHDLNDEWLAGLARDFDANRKGLAVSDQQQLFTQVCRKLLDELPINVIQDLDFWRYLSLFPFRNFVIITAANSDSYVPGKYGGNGDVAIERWTLIECLRWAYRLSNPGNDEDEYLTKLSDAHAEAGRSGKVRDQVISTVVRRKWASTSTASRAFTDAAIHEEPIFDEGSTSEERLLTVGFNGRIARLANNVLFDALDQQELTELFIEAR